MSLSNLGILGIANGQDTFYSRKNCALKTKAFLSKGYARVIKPHLYYTVQNKSIVKDLPPSLCFPIAFPPNSRGFEGKQLLLQ